MSEKKGGGGGRRGGQVGAMRIAMVNIAIATTIGMGGGAEGRETGRGEELFQKSCVACHVNGGNILAPGKGLTLKELGLNLGAATFDEVYR